MNLLTEQIVEALRGLGVESRLGGVDGPDVVARIPAREGAVEVPVEVKWRSQPLHESEAARWRQALTGPSILAQPSVPSGLGARYRALGISYVDSGGNAHLDFPGFHVHVEGRKPRVILSSGTRARSASTNPAGLRVTFVLLADPGSVNQSHDRLAELSGVSKGTVTNTLKDLRQRGHLVGERSDKVLVDQKALAQDWTDGYVRDLKPSLKELELSGPEPSWWINNWTDVSAGVVGGGVALAQMGASLRPDRALVYGTPPWRDVRRQARLTQSESSPVILRERFWSADFLPQERFSVPLLTYADALVDGDPREVEAAQELAELHGWSLA